MSPELKQFYREMQEWIDSGMPDHGVFEPGVALCYTYSEWTHRRSGRGELTEQFEAAGLHGIIPFNDSAFDFLREKNHYTNPARLAWIKEHAQ